MHSYLKDLEGAVLATNRINKASWTNEEFDKWRF